MTITNEIIQKFEAISSDYFSQSRKEMLPYIPAGTKRLLDIGCHKGAFGFLVKSTLGAEVWGIEIDEADAKIAEKQLDKVISGDVNIVLKDIPDRYFDCISCNDVLEHLLDP